MMLIPSGHHHHSHDSCICMGLAYDQRVANSINWPSSQSVLTPFLSFLLLCPCCKSSSCDKKYSHFSEDDRRDPALVFATVAKILQLEAHSTDSARRCGTAVHALFQWVFCTIGSCEISFLSHSVSRPICTKSNCSHRNLHVSRVVHTIRCFFADAVHLLVSRCMTRSKGSMHESDLDQCMRHLCLFFLDRSASVLQEFGFRAIKENNWLVRIKFQEMQMQEQ